MALAAQPQGAAQPIANSNVWVKRIGHVILRFWEEPVGIVTTLGIFLIFLGADQMADVFADLDSAGDGFWPWLRRVAAFWGGAAFLGLSAWYWTRAALMAPYDIDDTQTSTNAQTKLSGLGYSPEAITSREWAPRAALFFSALVAAAPLLVAFNNPTPHLIDTLRGAPWTAALGGVTTVLILSFLAIYRRQLHIVAPYAAPNLLWKMRITSVLAAAPFGWVVAAALFIGSVIASYVVAHYPAFVEEQFTTPAAGTLAMGFAIPFLVLTLALIRDIFVWLARAAAWVWRRIFGATSWPRPRSQSWLVFTTSLLALVIWVYASPIEPAWLFHIRTVSTNDTAQSIATRPDMESAIREYAAKRRGDLPAGTPVPAIIVAAEGGASRGAVWLLSAMRKLDQSTGGDFGRHVFAISSVSGGSLGAVTYVQALHSHGVPDGTMKWDEMDDGLKAFASSDLLETTIATFLLNDTVTRLFAPFGLVHMDDRGIALEKAFERVAWTKTFVKDPAAVDRSFMGLRAGDIWRPHLLINGTDADNGQRILTSSIRFEAKDDLFSGADDFLGIIKQDIPASTAVTNSARFPIVSPAGRYFDMRYLEPPIGDTEKRPPETLRKIIDGGYYENYGAETAFEVARFMSRLDGGKVVTPIVVIVSNDADVYAKQDMPPVADDVLNRPHLPLPALEESVVSCAPNHQRWYGAEAKAKSTAEGLSPLVGLVATRAAHGLSALQNLHRFLCEDAELPRLFNIALKKPKPGVESAPMNWVMSQKAGNFLLKTAIELPYNTQQGEHLAETLAHLKASPPKAVTDTASSGR